MNLQDVSQDPSVIGWLRQSGHAHLLDNQRSLHGASPFISPPIIPGGRISVDPYCDSFQRSTSFSRIDNPVIQSYNQPPSPMNLLTSPTQFLAPHMNQPHLDADIERFKHDPNTRVIQRPQENDVVYKQRVFVRYLQPPTPPVGGTIIVREKHPPPSPPEPPLIIRRPPPPPPPTPPPVVIRECPPPMPPPEGTTVIEKIVPAGPKPPRQVIIEQHPPLPPKPQDVIIERWLPVAPRQRRIFYERLPAPVCHQTSTRPIIIQHGQPTVRVHREVMTAPGSAYPYPQIGCHTDVNHLLSQIGGHQQTCSTLSPSSLISYNPHVTCQQTCCITCRSQPNIGVMPNIQPNPIPSLSYGLPLSCVCTPSSINGLGAYGCGISTVPTVCHSNRQSMVYSVPENIPVDSILRQLGVNPCCPSQSPGIMKCSSNIVTCVANNC